MKWLLFAELLLWSSGCLAQVKISPAKESFVRGERVQVSVVNDTGQPIAFCIHIFGETSPGGEIETTLLPFEVQTPRPGSWKRLFLKRWTTILMGPDMGAGDGRAELQSGKDTPFSFRIGAPEAKEFRLRLHYSRDPNAHVCSPEKKGRSVATSRIFRILPSPE